MLNRPIKWLSATFKIFQFVRNCYRTLPPEVGLWANTQCGDEKAGHLRLQWDTCWPLLWSFRKPSKISPDICFLKNASPYNHEWSWLWTSKMTVSCTCDTAEFLTQSTVKSMDECFMNQNETIWSPKSTVMKFCYPNPILLPFWNASYCLSLQYI